MIFYFKINFCRSTFGMKTFLKSIFIAGNCRVCLIKLKNSIKPVISCATNAKAALPNNSVYHDSALVKTHDKTF